MDKKDSMAKKEKIILAAKDMFANKGFNGTTMDELAKQAKVNKATIYYYFKDKEALYEYVFAESINNVVNDLEKRLKNTKTATDALKAYIDSFYFNSKEDETFMRILLRAVASQCYLFPKQVMKKFLRMLSILEDILDKGYNEGVFKKTDTKLVHFMIVGGISFLLTTKDKRSSIYETFDNTPKNFNKDDKYANRQLYEIILKGLGVK